MSTTVTLTKEGVCLLTFDNGIIYTFKDNAEMIQVGLSLVKNSLVSNIIINKEEVDDANETIKDFVVRITEDIYGDSGLLNGLKQYEVDSDSDSGEDSDSDSNEDSDSDSGEDSDNNKPVTDEITDKITDC
jgi:hypothetical protein